MQSAVWTFIALADAGRARQARLTLAMLPGWQVAAAFADFCTRCPDRSPAQRMALQKNALRVEPIEPQPRCRLQTPAEWGDTDPRAVRWLASGGDNMVLGLCSVQTCPRTRGPVPAAVEALPELVGRRVVLTRRVETNGGLVFEAGEELVVADRQPGDTFGLEGAGGRYVSGMAFDLDFKPLPEAA